MEENKNSKIVVYKDGSFKLIKDGITWEYENDENWLVTIKIDTESLNNYK